MASYSASQIAAISRLFSASVFKEMARRGRSPIFARLTRELNSVVDDLNDPSVGSFLEAAFQILKRGNNRGEYVYKSALIEKILLGRHSIHTASVINEFRVGACKADLAIFNGTATVYEIKSERDSLSRLENQIRAYKKFFAKIYVIAGENHVDVVAEKLPCEVGVLKLSSRYQITSLREARESYEDICTDVILDSIRATEAISILTGLGVDVPKVPNTILRSALADCFKSIEREELHRCLVHTLKKTRNLCSLASLVEDLPNSLRGAALTASLRRDDHSRLLQAVRTPLITAATWG